MPFIGIAYKDVPKELFNVDINSFETVSEEIEQNSSEWS